jgi:hypothetical protein
MKYYILAVDFYVSKYNLKCPCTAKLFTKLSKEKPEYLIALGVWKTIYDIIKQERSLEGVLNTTTKYEQIISHDICAKLRSIRLNK